MFRGIITQYEFSGLQQSKTVTLIADDKNT